ncbi:DRTGG domain-containing protein [Oscillospiraceae bacterium MB08-C2-2]|nr:DRTGG domain-containing protein [Oscillospiraceae bacterium MB08-C2-2]
MQIKDVIRILDAEIISGGDLDQEIQSACGSDMMSDALAFVKESSMLLTGLINPQVVRTSEMLDVHCIVFVRGKIPGTDTIALAQERNIVLLSTRHRMFTACGLLYEGGLRGGAE